MPLVTIVDEEPPQSGDIDVPIGADRRPRTDRAVSSIGAIPHQLTVGTELGEKKHARTELAGHVYGVIGGDGKSSREFLVEASRVRRRSVGALPGQRAVRTVLDRNTSASPSSVRVVPVTYTLPSDAKATSLASS